MIGSYKIRILRDYKQTNKRVYNIDIAECRFLEPGNPLIPTASGELSVPRDGWQETTLVQFTHSSARVGHDVFVNMKDVFEQAGHIVTYWGYAQKGRLIENQEIFLAKMQEVIRILPITKRHFSEETRQKFMMQLMESV
jgi:hypothetical protein